MRIQIIACRFGVGSSIFIFYFMIPDPASTFNTGSDPGKKIPICIFTFILHIKNSISLFLMSTETIDRKKIKLKHTTEINFI